MGGEGGGGFEDAGGGGTNGDELVGGISFFGKACGDFIMFCVHGVIAKVFCFDGAEGTEADVEGEEGVRKLGKEFGGEVEAGGGGGDGAGGLGIGSLVIGRVGGLEIGLALNFAGFENVRRKRRQTVLL